MANASISQGILRADFGMKIWLLFASRVTKTVQNKSLTLSKTIRDSCCVFLCTFAIKRKNLILLSEKVLFLVYFLIKFVCLFAFQSDKEVDDSLARAKAKRASMVKKALRYFEDKSNRSMSEDNLFTRRKNLAVHLGLDENVSLREIQKINTFSLPVPSSATPFSTATAPSPRWV